MIGGNAAHAGGEAAGHYQTRPRRAASDRPTARLRPRLIQENHHPITQHHGQIAELDGHNFQLSTPPDLPTHTADLPSRSYRTVARWRRTGMTRGESSLSMRARWSCRDNA